MMMSGPLPLSKLDHVLGVDCIDLFICSSSFEERCLVIPEQLVKYQIKQVLIAKNRSFASVVNSNFNAIAKHYGEKSSTLSIDSADPVFTARNIVDALRQTTPSGTKRVVIDITTFTHEALLILFRACNSALSDGVRVDFLYSPAREYSIGDGQDDKWLSKGIREVRSVIGYPGRFAPSRSTHLVLLAGFEDYRALSLIRELEPSIVSVGYGDRTETGTRGHQAINEAKANRIRALLGEVKDFVFSCYDPLRAETAIRQVIREAGVHNTVIAPMNTKISTLGAARVALLDDAVQVGYAQAEVYNHRNYSEPGNEFYHFCFVDWPLSQSGTGGGRGNPEI